MKRQPTTQQLTWFLDLHRNKQLDLDPPYQRKSVWSSKDRKFFLDTIFRNYPAPPIFIHRSVDDNGFTMYHVVDGKQRLETILSFFNNKISIPANFGNQNLDNKKFKDLDQIEKRKFWDYTLVVDFIDITEGNNIEEVFDRVNRNARNLQPQELRHARYNGWFINLVEQEADDDFWWIYKISTRARDKRMKNVQFISELLMIILENKIVGFDQDHINEIYSKYDEIEELQEAGEFSPDDFSEAISNIKRIILKMNEHNNVIDKYVSGSNNNFYTLWAYLTLNSIDDPIELAEVYDKFMSAVQKKDFEKSSKDVLSYIENSTGAVTELPQREARLQALTNELQ